MTSATTDRLSGITGSVAIKAPCRAATSGNITFSGLQTIDAPFSIVTAEGDRVLVRLQTDEKQNGIYIASAGEWVRAADFNGAKDVTSGTYVRVNQGTHIGLWYINTVDPVVIGTSAITFTKIIDNSSPNLGDLLGNSDDITQGSSNLFMTTAERSKLTGIAAGAEVNVNADWNAGSGDAQILNKPTLGTMAAQNANSVTITGGTISQLSHIGINATGDATNVISANGAAILLSNPSGSTQIKASKNIAASTCSHLFQTNFSSRAEFGLIGNNDFAMKVSSDGTNFTTSFTLDNATGNVNILQALTLSGNLTFGGTTLTDITGADTKLVSGTAGTNGNVAMWNSDGDVVDGSVVAANILVDGDIGVAVQAYDADILKADTTDVLTVGYATTPYNAGTISSGTLTPNEANGQQQYYVNGGAHTLAPPTNNTCLTIQVSNNASAGTIATSGFTIVTGDALTTTDGHDFFLRLEKLNGFSQLHVTALQ